MPTTTAKEAMVKAATSDRFTQDQQNQSRCFEVFMMAIAVEWGTEGIDFDLKAYL